MGIGNAVNYHMVYNPSMDYRSFLESKSQLGGDHGFEPLWMPLATFPFQEALTTWALRKGRAAEFADCGLGKSLMQLAWAENVVRRTARRVLIVTPLAVSPQTIREGEKFGVEVRRSRDGQPAGPITVTNYEQLHRFDAADYVGMVCDESSAIKNFEAKRQAVVSEFMRRLPYRLLGTATAAPNDFVELGTSSEALGELGRLDMLSTFFRNDENSNHPIWWGARWRLKPHASEAFWRWVCSWARACRKPSDLGFSDEGFDLPPLTEREHVIENYDPPEGMLFHVPATTLDEQKEERRRTTQQRCEKVAELADHDRAVVCWCHLNTEADLLERLIPGSRQVSGAMDDDEKEDLFLAFQSGELRCLITKPRIGGFGLNWQHCAHQITFPSHSFESHYQQTRRSWRFGQKREVVVDIVTTEGERGVLMNLKRKAAEADRMFSNLVAHMNGAIRIQRDNKRTRPLEIPSWL
jgi:hypothetical protein